ncbi:MAG: hypothetical protein AAFX06_16125 [Planctomycetota bacterium]
MRWILVALLLSLNLWITEAHAQLGGGFARSSVPANGLNGAGGFAASATTWVHTQHGFPVDGLPLGIPSEKGKSILSRPCDPLMTAERESELISILYRENPFDWSRETTLQRVAESLSTLAPVRIDVRALDEIGLDPNLKVIDRTYGLMKVESKSESPTAAAQDASPRATESPTELRTEPATTSKWWSSKVTPSNTIRTRSPAARSSRRSRTPATRSLCAVLESMFQDYELVLEIRGGQFLITTSDEAEYSPITRLYDVRPIVQPTNFGNLSGYKDFDSIINFIQTTVAPDAWEALGGNSTMTVYSVHGHDWLTISTTTQIHLRIQTLLDGLNR